MLTNLKLKVLIVLILIVPAVPRINSADIGLPYLQFWDEPLIILGAVNGLKRIYDEDNNTNFLPITSEVVYGGYMRYTCMAVDVFYYLYLRITDPNVYSWYDVKTDIYGYQPLTISHPGFFYWNRVYLGLLSALSFVFMFLLGRLRFGIFNGLFAVLILGANVMHFGSSYIVNSNIPLGTWTIATLYYAVYYNHTREYRYLIISMIFSGLAFSTKMTGAAVVLFPATAVLLNYAEFKEEKFLKTLLKAFYLGLIPLGIFVILNPSIYLDTNHFLLWMNWLSDTYRSPIGNFSKEPGWEHFAYQLREFSNQLGKTHTILMIIGLAIGLVSLIKIRKDGIQSSRTDIVIFVVFPVIYLVYVTTQYTVAYHRNFLLYYPILSLLAAQGITYIVQFTCSQFKRLNRFRFLINGILLVIIFIINWPLYRSIQRSSQYNHNASDTRSRAIDSFIDQSNNQSIILGIEKGFKMSMYDLNKLGTSYGYFSIANIQEATLGFTHLLVPSYTSEYEDQTAFTPKELKELDSLISSLKISSIPGSKINYFHDQVPWEPIANPTVTLLKGSPYPPPKMKDFTVPSIYRSSLSILDHIPDLIFKGKIEPGIYTLTFELSGMEALGEFPQVEILLNDQAVTPLVTATSDFISFEYKVEIPDNPFKMYINMPNDYWNPETGEDRNAFIRNLELRKHLD